MMCNQCECDTGSELPFWIKVAMLLGVMGSVGLSVALFWGIGRIVGVW